MTLRMRHELGDRFDIVVAAQPLDSGGGEVLRPRDEGPLPLAVYPDGCLYRRWATDALDRINRPWRIAIASPSRSAILAAVAEGCSASLQYCLRSK
jgi:DNA-binding transcriptional LysR family regulator